MKTELKFQSGYHYFKMSYRGQIASDTGRVRVILKWSLGHSVCGLLGDGYSYNL